MKILVGISYYYPNVSGLTLYAKRIAEEMSARGHEVRVLTSHHDKALPSAEKRSNVFIKRLWTPFVLGRGPIMPTYIYEAFKQARWADVVNLHAPQFEGFFLAIFAKVLGKKVVMTHHCELSNWPGLVNQITEKTAYLSLLMQGVFSDKIVSYTEDYAENSKYLKRFQNKLMFILPPVKLEPKPDSKILNKFPNAKYKIGFAGRIAKEKGIQHLIKALPYLNKTLGNDLKLLLAGPSDQVIGGGYKSELARLVRKYKTQVVFVGTLSQKQMPSFYEHIDVLVLPSTQKIESFGFVQVEAMLSGCPVVASDMPGVRIPIRLTKMGKTAEPGNSRELAKSMVKVLKNKKKYQSKSKVARSTFVFKKTIDFYEKLYTDLLKK